MRIIRTGAVVIAAAVLATVGLSGQAAQAGGTSVQSAADCERGANGFIDIPDTLTGNVVRRLDLYGQPPGGVWVELHAGTIGGVRRGWSMIRGSTNPGDLVWMDWTRDGGASWIQCGPFEINYSGQTKTSAAQRTSSSSAWLFRACGMLYRQPWTTGCTAWW